MAAALLAQNPLEEHDYKFAIFAFDKTWHTEPNKA